MLRLLDCYSRKKLKISHKTIIEIYAFMKQRFCRILAVKLDMILDSLDLECNLEWRKSFSIKILLQKILFAAAVGKQSIFTAEIRFMCTVEKWN